MGVSGAGKTTVGRQLAATLGWRFVDADVFHPTRNVEKMRAGFALSDADRAAWLDELRDAIQEWLATDTDVVLACSALKARYRIRLRIDPDRVPVVYLRAPFAVAFKRLATRTDHFMPPELLPTQYHTLEEPRDAITVDADAPPDRVVAEILHRLPSTRSPHLG
ncbi:MAG TPA: gluconokinase [Nitrospirales bacterium]|nr:gluconokinase [Nitrospirales bacterium]